MNTTSEAINLGRNQTYLRRLSSSSQDATSLFFARHVAEQGEKHFAVWNFAACLYWKGCENQELNCSREMAKGQADSWVNCCRGRWSLDLFIHFKRNWYRKTATLDPPKFLDQCCAQRSKNNQVLSDWQVILLPMTTQCMLSIPNPEF